MRDRVSLGPQRLSATPACDEPNAGEQQHERAGLWNGDLDVVDRQTGKIDGVSERLPDLEAEDVGSTIADQEIAVSGIDERRQRGQIFDEGGGRRCEHPLEVSTETTDMGNLD